MGVIHFAERPQYTLVIKVAGPERPAVALAQVKVANAPAVDSDGQAEFALEFKRRAFRWAAQRVRNEFTESTWQAFWQTGVQNRPVEEVAGELGMSAGAVYVARSRVLARLRDRVEQLTEDTGLNVGGEADDGALQDL